MSVRIGYSNSDGSKCTIAELGVTLEDGQRYCLLDGRLLDYVGYCGNSRPVTIESEQMTFGDFKLD